MQVFEDLTASGQYHTTFNAQSWFHTETESIQGHFANYIRFQHKSQIFSRRFFGDKTLKFGTRGIWAPNQPLTNVFLLLFSPEILDLLTPMLMETRCCKSLFPNYSKRKSAEDTLVPPLCEKLESEYIHKALRSAGGLRRPLRLLRKQK